MIVVSDTSPLNYLVRIGLVDILGKLFSEVYIPPSVSTELGRGGAPQAVRDWVASPPAWLTIRQPVQAIVQPALDPGECDAMSLAIELGISQVLIDERDGRAHAASLGLEAIGTLAVLQKAAMVKLIDLHQAVDLLLQTNFRVSKRLLRDIRSQGSLARP